MTEAVAVPEVSPAPRIVPAVAEWSYPQMKAEYLAGSGNWVEVSEAFYWEALGVLPPHYFAGGFAVPEPWMHTDQGHPVLAGFTEKAGRYFARYGTVPELVEAAELLRWGGVEDVAR